MADMSASDGGISLLMAAEKSASEEIARARAERGEKMKLAKAEAEADIGSYKTEQENVFQLKGASDDNTGDAVKLKSETDKEIAAMKGDFAKNRDKVLEMMVNTCSDVTIVVPEARKRGN